MRARKNLRRITPPPAFAVNEHGPSYVLVNGNGELVGTFVATSYRVCSNTWARFMMDRLERHDRLAQWLPPKFETAGALTQLG